MILAETMARDLLLKVYEGRRYMSIQPQDVEEILSNDEFTTKEGFLTTVEKTNTLLHLAARCNHDTVLPLVSQAYKRSKVFCKAMQMRNENDKSPILIAIEASQFSNTVFLECLQLCPEALYPYENGWSLMHSALCTSDNLSLVKFLLSQDMCLPMLLSKFECYDRGILKPLHQPLHLAQTLVHRCEMALQRAEGNHKFFSKNNPHSHGHTDFQYQSMVAPLKVPVEKAKDMLSAIELPTMQLQAEENKRQAIELEKKRCREREETFGKEMDILIEDGNMEAVVHRYLMADADETQKITVCYLAGKLECATEHFSLPPLTVKILRMLMTFLKLPPTDPVVPCTLTLLEKYSKTTANISLIVGKEANLLSMVVLLMCCSNVSLQSLCAGFIYNFYSHCPASFLKPASDSDIIQMLLLVKYFSCCDKAKILAGEALLVLGVEGGKEPDPGTWTVQQVAFWMESHTEIECRSDYCIKFLDAGINGLHLLELSAAEMMGLGVKFVSHQRKLSSLIDDLRRSNRSILGKKDIFLSYAHLDIKFAREVKRALNGSGYTVWLDETGIRAGQKWRNEIADGIKNSSCLLFIMTPRSANSDYCQDEVSLAEEYHKPIMTIRHQEATEIDPGLKLVLYRRQLIDFSQGELFETNSRELIVGIRATIGEGSGLENEVDVRVTESIATSDEYSSAAGHSNSDLETTREVQDVFIHTEDSRELVRQVVREVLAEEDGPLREVVKEVMAVESGCGGCGGKVRQVVREVLLVEGGVGGAIREAVRGMVAEELEQLKMELRILEDKLYRLEVQ